MSYTIASAVTGDYPDYEIDPSKVLVSRGALTSAASTFASYDDGAIEFQWENNSGKGSAKPTDKALLAIINLAKGEAMSDAAGVLRPLCVQTLAVPAEWAGDEVHAYMGFISDDGKEVANSVYLGAVTIA